MPRPRAEVLTDGWGYGIDIETGELWMYGPIGEWSLGLTPDTLARDLKRTKAKALTLYLNSPGGDVYDGVAIRNMLVRDGRLKTVVVDGLAASIASVVATAGETIRMMPGTMMMIHDPWSVIIGDAAEMREAADWLAKTGAVLADIYAARTGRSAAEMRRLMVAETWLSPAEAVELGLADEAVAEEDAAAAALASRAAARFDLSVFARAPTDGGRFVAAPRPDADETPKQFFRRAAAFYAPGRFRTSAATSAAKPKEQHMDFNAWLTSKGHDPAALDEARTAELRAEYDAETAPAMPKPKARRKAPAPPADDAATPADDAETDPVPAMRARAADELRRQAALAAVPGIERHPSILASALAEGWTTDRTELEVLRASRPQVRPNGGGNEPGVGAVMETSLSLRAGVAPAVMAAQHGQRVVDAAMDRRFRNLGLQGTVRSFLRHHGADVPDGGLGNDEIHRALEIERGLPRNEASTISLSGILGNVANKTMLAAYASVEAVVPMVFRVTDVNDFKAHTRYLLTMGGDVEEVGPGGEIKHGTLGEESYTQQISTRGLMLGLTRTMIINDDLGAFLQIPMHMGRKCAVAVERAGMTLVAGAQTAGFFASGNRNLVTGAGSALAIAGLTASEATFLNQSTAASGASAAVVNKADPVLITPAILLVPPALKVVAEQLYKDTVVNEAATAGSPKPNSNPHAGKFKPASSPFLSNAGITGYSTAAWYHLADPADVAAFEIAFLRGQRTPTVEQGVPDFSTLGILWRCFFDFGVARADFRGAVKNAGA
jgi:ATP-dependent protease ClpP protease subunit